MENERESILELKHYGKIISAKRFENGGSTSVFRPYPDVTLHDLIDDFVTCCVGAGFLFEGVIAGLRDYAEEYSNDDE
jgi:hypothetical protein